MMIREVCKPALVVMSLMLTLPIGGQPQQGDTLLWHDLSYLRDTDPWLMSHNASALTRLGDARLSEATVGMTWGHGGLVDFHQSSRSLQADATVESLYRLSSRTVVYGRMSYDNVTGHDMAGSAFLHHSHLPFDIVEDSLTNTGKKHSDTYQLTGALGVDLFQGMSIGGRIDYTAANYAKYKDLRHKNSLMDLVATAGVYVPVGTAVRFGGHFYYRRNTESLQFSTYGKTDKTYKSLIDYGAFIGEVEQFGVDRFTDPSRELPLFDEYIGGGAQVDVQILPGLNWYHSLSTASREGYYGRKSPYTTQLSHHDSRVYELHSRLSLHRPSTHHALDFTMRTENLSNYEETFRELKNEAGSNYYEYYDPIKTVNKVWAEGELTYTLHLGIRHQMPATTVRGGVRMTQRNQTAYDYPYFRRQKLNQREYSLLCQHRLPLGHGLMSVTAVGSFSKGHGKPYTDGTFATPSDKQVPPPQMETYLYREYEYLMAPQYSIQLALRYSQKLPGTSTVAYIDASASHRKANGAIEHLTGRDRTTLRMAVGCAF